jgi:hypothetical protein
MQSSFTYAKVFRSNAASNEYTHTGDTVLASALDKLHLGGVPAFRRKCELKIKRMYTKVPLVKDTKRNQQRVPLFPFLLALPVFAFIAFSTPHSWIV